ncbi:MAG: hypothetical protein KME30_02000 [Iphinoe sp. HA4291-MV1]|jgi:hypothetical protein|nr:hypothetical protein [Iphinoe sp. HA4291-MV1]
MLCLTQQSQLLSPELLSLKAQATSALLRVDARRVECELTLTQSVSKGDTHKLQTIEGISLLMSGDVSRWRSLSAGLTGLPSGFASPSS